MRIRDRTRPRITLRLPLMRTGRALSQLPLVAKEILEEVVAPLRGRLCPGDFQAAADGVAALAFAKLALPAQALFFNVCRLWLGAHQFGIAGAVGFSESVSASDERVRLLIVHCHAA